MLVNFIFQGVQSLFATTHFPSVSVEYHFHATITTLMCSKSCRLNLPIFCLVCGHFWNALVIVIPFLFHQWNNPFVFAANIKHTPEKL